MMSTTSNTPVQRAQRLVVIPAVLALGLSFAACTRAGGGSESDDVVIGQSIPTLDNPWYASFSQGSKDMAEALGVELNQVTNPAATAYDPGAQVSAIENLIAQRPDVIQIDPTSSDAINGAIEEARSADIPVVTDGITVTTDVDASVIADNKQGGKLAGEYVAKALPDGGDVAVLEGTPGRDIVTQRQVGFKDGLGSNPKAKIVSSQIANLDRSEGQTVTENILQANQGLSALWGASDTMALGGLEALKSRKLAGDVVLGGFDGTPEAFEAIKAGTMAFTIDQVPYEMGATAIALAYLIATDGEVDAATVLPTQLVDASNVDDYLANADQKNKATLQMVVDTYSLETK